MAQQSISQSDFLKLCAKFRKAQDSSIIRYFIENDFNTFELSNDKLEEYNAFFEKCLFEKLINDATNTLTLEEVVESMKKASR